MTRFLFVMAWRNLWRQKRRTGLTLAAIMVGIACLVFFISLMTGFSKRLVLLGTETMKGEAQIHVKGFVDTHDMELIITDAAALIHKLEASPPIRAVSPRLYSPALAAMGDRSVSIEIIGIDPDREKNISNWEKHLWKGNYIQKPGEIMLGKKLAEKLELDIGGKLVLTVAEIESGELNSQLFVVAGIVWSQNPQLNEMVGIVNLSDAGSLSGTVGAVHEIAMKLNGDTSSSLAIHQSCDPLLGEPFELHSWQELLPEVTFLLNFQEYFMGFAFVIIMFLVAMGMVNTMGMAILERIREFGVLQALGTKPAMLIKMVMFEFVWLGVLGVTAGVFIGWAITLWLGTVGIPLGQVEVTGFLLTEPLHPLMDWLRTIIYAVIFCMFIPVFTLVPIHRITKLDTVNALRFS